MTVAVAVADPDEGSVIVDGEMVSVATAGVHTPLRHMLPDEH